MAFEDGMRFGAQMVDSAFQRERQARLDAAAAEERGLRMRGLQREQDRADRVDTATQEYGALAARGGMNERLEGQIQQTYGMNPDQVRAAGTGLQAKLTSYDAPDNFDLQSTPAYRQPAGVNVGLEQRRNLVGARQKISAAAGNIAGMQAGERESMGLDIEQDFMANQKRLMDPKFREELASSINTQSSNITVNEPKLDPKTGRPLGPPTLSVVTSSGKGKLIELNDAQYLQLAHARTLSERGLVDEAMKRIEAVDKDLADAVKRANDATGKSFDSNRQAQSVYDMGEDRRLDREQLGKYQEGQLGIARAGLALRAAGGRGGRGGTGDDEGPQFKFVKTETGDFWADQNGVPVAKYDPKMKGGMSPFDPDPMTDPRLAATAKAKGVTTQAGMVDGRVMWGFVSPNGRVYGTLEEAATSADATQSMQSTRTRPSAEMARRTGLPQRPAIAPDTGNAMGY